MPRALYVGVLRCHSTLVELHQAAVFGSLDLCAITFLMVWVNGALFFLGLSGTLPGHRLSIMLPLHQHGTHLP